MPSWGMNLEIKDRGRDTYCYAPTGEPEAVTRLRLPQNAACGFPALGSSEVDSQFGEGLQLRSLWVLELCPRKGSVGVGQERRTQRGQKRPTNCHSFTD